MLALCSILSETHYAQNYAGIIGLGLIITCFNIIVVLGEFKVIQYCPLSVKLLGAMLKKSSCLCIQYRVLLED